MGKARKPELWAPPPFCPPPLGRIYGPEPSQLARNKNLTAVQMVPRRFQSLAIVTRNFQGCSVATASPGFRNLDKDFGGVPPQKVWILPSQMGKSTDDLINLGSISKETGRVVLVPIFDPHPCWPNFTYIVFCPMVQLGERWDSWTEQAEHPWRRQRYAARRQSTRRTAFDARLDRPRDQSRGRFLLRVFVPPCFFSPPAGITILKCLERKARRKTTICRATL